MKKKGKGLWQGQFLDLQFVCYLWKKYGLKSVFFRNFFCFFVLVFVIFVTMISWFFVTSKKNIESEHIAIAEATAARVLEDIEDSLTKARKTVANLIIDEDVHFFLSNNLVVYSEEILEERIVSKIRSYKNITTAVSSISVYSKSRQKIISQDGLVRAEQYKDIEWLSGIEFSEGQRTSVFVRKKADGSNVISLSGPIESAERHGIVSLDINVNLLRQELQKRFRGAEVELINNGQIIFSTDLSRFAQKVGEGAETEDFFDQKDTEYWSAVYTSLTGIEKCIIRIPIENHTDLMKKLTLNTSLLLTFFVFLDLVLSYLFAKYSSDPLAKLMQGLTIDHQEETEIRDEIEEISRRIVYLVNNNEELKEKLDASLTDFSKLQLAAMKTQITPHYINNTLSVISMMAAIEYGAEDKIANALNNFSDMMSYSFNSEKMFITVEEEKEFLQSYMKIMKVTYPSIDITLQIGEGIERWKLLRVCIQPLVENAIFHGLRERKKGSYIHVMLEEREGALLLTVTDNGIGLSQEELQRINEEIRIYSSVNIAVGLRNIYQRLLLVYKENMEFTIESEEGKGMTIRVLFPQEI